MLTLFAASRGDPAQVEYPLPVAHVVAGASCPEQARQAASTYRKVVEFLRALVVTARGKLALSRAEFKGRDGFLAFLQQQATDLEERAAQEPLLWHPPCPSKLTNSGRDFACLAAYFADPKRRQVLQILSAGLAAEGLGAALVASTGVSVGLPAFVRDFLSVELFLFCRWAPCAAVTDCTVEAFEMRAGYSQPPKFSGNIWFDSNYQWSVRLGLPDRYCRLEADKTLVACLLAYQTFWRPLLLQQVPRPDAAVEYLFPESNGAAMHSLPAALAHLALWGGGTTLFVTGRHLVQLRDELQSERRAIRGIFV
jgi:hypothetical protein